MMIEPVLTRAPWTPHLETMDMAIATHSASAAVLAWRNAYSSALDQPGWQGLVEVAGAALRIGAIPGFRKAAESRARESYWTALFRARRQGSLNGVLDAAEAFGALGDGMMVEQCVRIAERLALLTGDAAAADRVRALAADLAQRYVEADRPEMTSRLAFPR
ncbi:MAG TPA: hypothetical protein VFV05_16780 [Methylomirabilota bacterium]|nr:hypothetical protein [Methylomirabilota bacterium]